MLGAIIGDIVGSVYEGERVKTTEFELLPRFARFTDDSVLTVAIADALLQRDRARRPPHRWRFVEDRRTRAIYAGKLREYGRKYPHAGYGQLFEQWMRGERLRGYRSYGNGAAMRASPIGWAFDTLDEVLREARLSAMVTHSHREGIKGAQAVAVAVFLARTGAGKEEIRAVVERRFRYDLGRSLDAIRPSYEFDSSARGSVPQAIRAFLESADYESAIRNAVSLGGDADTQACIAGAIAHAHYRSLPGLLVDQCMLLLDHGLKDVMRAFQQRFDIPY